MPSDPFVGEIMLWAGTFAPRDWAFCNGQLVQISQNPALYSLLGTYYGGDGITTFALPDLRGRVPIGFGQGPGLSNRPLGQSSGQETVTLTQTQMPSHSHTLSLQLKASSSRATAENPAGNFPARAPDNMYSNSSDTNMNPNAVSGTVGNTGGGQPHNNMQPYLALNYCIALMGLYPSRS